MYFSVFFNFTGCAEDNLYILKVIDQIDVLINCIDFCQMRILYKYTVTQRELFIPFIS